MAIPGPTATELARLAERLGFAFDPADVALFRGLMRGGLDAYGSLDALPEALPEPKYPRLPGSKPTGADNPLGAWARLTDIQGAASGKLAGRRVAIKDCICVAGVPLMNGSAALDGYTPEVDATVVARILDAGGIIAGKTANEDYCYSGGSHTNARGPVDNPHRAGFTTGGSSSGSAALVGAGIVELALGTDQGGSVRVPSACCGIVGMKPTHGLVPCTGALGMEYSLDHIGPMTRTVADNAVLLEVMAGPDGYDSRQGGAVTDRYTADLDGGARGLRIGVLTEAFGLPQADPRTEAAVRAAIARLTSLGAEAEAVSVPLHSHGNAIWLPLAAEGCLATMFHGNGFGHGPKGVYLPSAMQRQSLWRAQTGLLPDTVKLAMLLGEYMGGTYGGRYYGRAHNLLRLLGEAYDAALARFDVLVCPTLPFPPPPRPAADAGRETALAAAFGMTVTASPFNATGHPSLSLNCGWVDGLPVGLMLTGRRWSERLIYRAAAAFEAALTDVAGEDAKSRSLPN